MAGTIWTSGISSPSPSDPSGTELVVVEAPTLVSSKGISEPRCDASELGSSLKPKEGEKQAPRAGETSGTKPRKLAKPSSMLASAVEILGEVLFAPEAPRGMFCFLLKGTSSGISSILAEGLFLVTGLGDGGASLLFLTALFLAIIILPLEILYPRNCLKFSSVTMLSNSISSNFSALTLATD
jgi:hypothetical protein